MNLNIFFVKSQDLYAKVRELTFAKTRCDDASEIFKRTYDAVDQNQFTTLLPIVSDDIRDRGGKYISMAGCIQPISLEFDHCPMEIQEERVMLLAERMDAPMFAVHSGNKSIHLYIFKSSSLILSMSINGSAISLQRIWQRNIQTASTNGTRLGENG